MTKALVALTAASLIMLGATAADAKRGGGDGGGGGHDGGGGGHHDGGGGHHDGGGGGHHDGGGHHHGHYKFNRHSLWWGYPWSPTRCHYEPRKVRVKVRDQWGRAYFARAWRNVKVCD